MAHLVVSASVAAILVVAASFSGTTVPDTSEPGGSGDQALVDEAIEHFQQRLQTTGWFADPEDDDDDDDDDEDDDAEDEAFNKCIQASDPDGTLGELLSAKPSASLDAAAESDELTWAAPSDSATTEALSFEIPAEETIQATAVLVGADATDLVEAVVELFREDAFSGCIEEGFGTSVGEEMEGAELEITAKPRGDLGVGESSSGVDIHLSGIVLIPIEFDLTLMAARADRALVMLFHGTFGEPLSGIDPVAELTALLESVTGAAPAS